jgi:hypothetical protein
MNLGELLIDLDDRVGVEPGAVGHWYALLDVTAFASVAHAESSVRSIVAPGQSWVNLYADMAGLELSAQGPRIARMHDDRGAFDRFELTPGLARGISFLQLQDQSSSLEAHLIALREVSLPDGSIALFRYQDPRVIAALVPLLDPKQQTALLGPATRWLCTDPCGGRHRVACDFSEKPKTAFRLSGKQLAVVDEALLPYEVLAQTREADSAVLAGMDPCRQLTAARQRISQARTHGLSVTSDVSLYCVLSFQLPEGFGDESPFKEAIAVARDGKSTFSQGLDGADPRSWAKWNDILARQDGMGD